jgi:quaternary ammonium compound-resistance protein SugE
MAWLMLFFAGVLETAWAVGLKYTDGWTRLWPSLLTALCMIVSFVLLSHAVKSLPLGTAYAVWVGIGTVGVVLVDTLILGQSISPIRAFFIVLICLGIIGLKASDG